MRFEFEFEVKVDFVVVPNGEGSVKIDVEV